MSIQILRPEYWLAWRQLLCWSWWHFVCSTLSWLSIIYILHLHIQWEIPMTLRPLKCLLHTLMVHTFGSSLSPLVHIYVHIAEVWWLYHVEHIIIHDLFINTRLAERSILKCCPLLFCSDVMWNRMPKTPHSLILYDGVRNLELLMVAFLVK